MNNQQTIEVDPAVSAPSVVEPATAASDTEPVTGKLVEETLVEEVSIDGMCGVY